MAYFTIMTGLRGCYMPDQSYRLKCDTRRALKEAIATEASYQREAGVQGLGKAAIASHAAECWRRRNDARWNLDLVLAYGHGKDRSFGIMVSRSTSADYRAYLKSDAD